MFYILYGQDDFSLHGALGKIKADLGDSETLSVNTSSLDGQHLTLNELKNQCGAIPFLSSYRLVIVNGLLQCFEAKQGKSRPSKGSTKYENKLREWRGLDSYIKQMPDTTVLILVDGEIKNQNPLLKKLSSLAKVKRFPLLQGKNLRTWIEHRVIEENGNITPQAVSLLVELIGGDLWAMNNEIQKLVLYSQDRPIREDDIRQLVSYAQEANIFTMVDAVAEGRTDLAQMTLHRLYQDGVAPIYILTMITRQFRLIALLKDLKPGLSYQQIQDRLGLKSSYILDKTLAQAKLYNLEGIKQAYDKLLETDSAIKTGKYNDELALELLVAELSAFQL